MVDLITSQVFLVGGNGEKTWKDFLFFLGGERTLKEICRESSKQQKKVTEIKFVGKLPCQTCPQSKLGW